MHRGTINRANLLGIALSGLGLVALFSALAPLAGSHLNQGPAPESSSELSFLEDRRNLGQAKAYPIFATDPESFSTELVALDELIATSPKARRFFPRNDQLSDLFEFIVSKSEQYGVSPLLVLSLIEVESGFSPGAVSRRGAVGLMQLMPDTAEEVAHSSGMSWRPELLNDPKVNIELGLRYMKMLKEQFKSVDKVLIAYNIGPAALQEKLAQGESVSLDYYYRVNSRFVSYRRNPRLPRLRSRHWAKAWL